MAYKSIEMLRLYRRYSEAKYRCNNPKYRNYCDYGGRGIQFKFNSFQEFLDCLGPLPVGDYSVERINNDGNYEPGNVKWGTRVEQQLNKRTYKSNKTGIKGVSFDSIKERWRAQYRSVIVYQGYDFFEACCVRKTHELCK